jgi:hypothetical protein
MRVDGPPLILRGGLTSCFCHSRPDGESETTQANLALYDEPSSGYFGNNAETPTGSGERCQTGSLKGVTAMVFRKMGPNHGLGFAGEHFLNLFESLAKAGGLIDKWTSARPVATFGPGSSSGRLVRPGEDVFG